MASPEKGTRGESDSRGGNRISGSRPEPSIGPLVRMPGGPPRILLLGANGQLGFELRRSLAVLGEVIAPAHRDCDLEQASSVRHCVRTARPDVIVNAAAWTDVEGAEAQPDRVMAVNGDGPSLLAEEANALGALLVHYSSDYVFDGRLGRPCTETDAPAPLGVYGRSKRAGDDAARQARRHLVLRAGWVYGTQGGNFLKTMLGLMQRRERITVVADQFGAPTGADLIADVTAHLVARCVAACDAGGQAAQDLPEASRRMSTGGAPTVAPTWAAAGGFPYGLYHLAASGGTSWHGYACLVAEQARAAGLTLALAEDGIAPIPSSAWPSAVERPADSRLDTARLRDTFELVMPPWQDGVARAVARLAEGARLCAP